MQLPNPQFDLQSASHRCAYKFLFPQLSQAHQTAYFDSAATVQRPEVVLQAEHSYLTSTYANNGRGQYSWAVVTDEIIQQTRKELCAFLHGADGSEIVFTSGATMSLNLVAMAWGLHNLKDGDEVVYCLSDHHSMTQPWESLQRQLTREGKSIVLKRYALTESGGIDLESLRSAISANTQIVNVTHINNTSGVINDLCEIRRAVGDDVLLNVDIAQSLSHSPLDIGRASVDFASFSGHKCFATTGIGGLYLSARVQEFMRTTFVGGGQESIREHLFTPSRLEAGTLNITGIVSLRFAIQFLQSLGMEQVHGYVSKLTKYIHNELLLRNYITFRYPVRAYEIDNRMGVVSFSIEGVEAQDVAEFLANRGIFVRSGGMCAGRKREDLIRVSVHVYNDYSEVDRLVAALDDLHKLLLRT